MGRSTPQDGQSGHATHDIEMQERPGTDWWRKQQRQVEQESSTAPPISSDLKVDRVFRFLEHQRLLLPDEQGQDTADDTKYAVPVQKLASGD